VRLQKVEQVLKVVAKYGRNVAEAGSFRELTKS
jgi:hypothetical protein